VLRTIDVDSGHPVSVDTEALLTDGHRLTIEAPALLPELATVKTVSVLLRQQAGDASSLDSCVEESPTSSTTSARVVQYFPNSADVHTEASNCSNANNPTVPPLSCDNRVVQKQIRIPTLFVKAVHRRSYVPSAMTNSRGNCILPRNVDTNLQLQRALMHLHNQLRRGALLLGSQLPAVRLTPLVAAPQRTTRTAQDTLSTALRRCHELTLATALSSLLYSSDGQVATRSDFLASTVMHTLR